jgi:hypothetical protein
MIPAQWDRRIRRATELSSTYSFAAEGLRFYARVATFQKSLYAEIQKALGIRPRFPLTVLFETNWIFSSSCRGFPHFYP